jgi:hypothetical protein
VSGRTQACGRPEAQVRLDQARAFLDVADLVGAEQNDLATPGVTTALAVLAGIAASDAACCAALGRRARGQDHREALTLLRQVAPEGPKMAQDLRRLLDVKDGAQYGMVYVTSQKAAAAVQQARRIVEAASAVLR